MFFVLFFVAKLLFPVCSSQLFDSEVLQYQRLELSSWDPIYKISYDTLMIIL